MYVAWIKISMTSYCAISCSVRICVSSSAGSMGFSFIHSRKDLNLIKKQSASRWKSKRVKSVKFISDITWMLVFSCVYVDYECLGGEESSSREPLLKTCCGLLLHMWKQVIITYIPLMAAINNSVTTNYLKTDTSKFTTKI